MIIKHYGNITGVVTLFQFKFGFNFNMENEK